MKKFEQFISNDIEISVSLLNKYCEHIVSEWYKNIEKYENIEYVINTLRVPDPGNILKVATTKRGRLIFRAFLILPSDLDEAIESLEIVKKCCKIDKCFHYIETGTDSTKIRIEITLDNIDKNLLKSLMGINKYKL